MGDNFKFIYLHYGDNKRYLSEIKYSIMSLLAEDERARGSIYIYTDNPEKFSADSERVNVVDISATKVEMFGPHGFGLRAKLVVLLDALRRFECPCVFLDTDTFVRRGFARMIRWRLQNGAVLDRYVRSNPYPQCDGVVVNCPSGSFYRYDPACATMYNSGLIGVLPVHKKAVEDAIAITDVLYPLTRSFTHDQEQFAINAALQLHGVRILRVRWFFKHYCATWEKRYMHWRFERMKPFADAPIQPRRPSITVNKLIGQTMKRIVAVNAAWRRGATDRAAK